MAKDIDPQQFQKHYSESSFWKKLGKHALKIGKSLVENALKLYYASKDPNTPMWAKGTGFGALGYLISPIDAIPDAIPVAGYTDDAAAVVLALKILAAYVTPAIKQQAQGKLREWFE